jgi:hypothetical protein
MKSEPFTGTVSAMKTNSVWLASEDLLGLPEAKVTINRVTRNENVEMDGGRKEPVLFSIGFEGKQREMILNATNRKTLSGAFGASTKNWIGKQVILYVQDGIRKPGGKRGETCTGLRIRIPADNNPLAGGGA